MQAGNFSMAMAPRILIMIPYPSTIGFAIGRLIGTFFEAAARAAGDADRVHFCFTDVAGGACRFLPAGFPRVIGVDFRGAREDFSKLGRYAQEQQIDLVFALDSPVQAPCLPSLRRAGVKTVISYWGAPMSSVNFGLRRLAKQLEVRWLRPHKPDLFIFESHAMKDMGVLGRGLAESATTVIRTGVDPDIFHPIATEKDTVYRLLQIPRERKIVVFMGHLHERKGVHVLLQAANKVVVDHGRTDIHFLFLGDREGEADHFLAHHGEAVRRGYVTFGGYHTNIPELLAGCYVGCIPSSGWDSYPMSSLEMQACGLPVVVSDLQGVPETIEDGKSGISVPTADPDALAAALIRLCDNPELRDRMSRYARERVVRSLTTTHQVIALERAISQAYEMHHII
jgi:glycosyltransferase involved in cell wall biosynthesis